jgi:hypothetical protein
MFELVGRCAKIDLMLRIKGKNLRAEARANRGCWI